MNCWISWSLCFSAPSAVLTLGSRFMLLVCLNKTGGRLFYLSPWHSFSRYLGTRVLFDFLTTLKDVSNLGLAPYTLILIVKSSPWMARLSGVLPPRMVLFSGRTLRKLVSRKAVQSTVHKSTVEFMGLHHFSALISRCVVCGKICFTIRSTSPW